MIRPATAADVERMGEIELDAGQRFRDVGLDVVADDDPPSPEELAPHLRRGTAWVAEEGGVVIGYATASIVDGHAHLEQVSVVRPAAGRGIGRDLIDRAAVWAREAGLPTLSLTTYRDVPWNGPYYERLGFRVVSDDDIGPQVAAIRQQEAAAGLDVAPRVVMARTPPGA